MPSYNTFTTYNGNGVTTDFAIPFEYQDASEVQVARKNGSVTYVFLNPQLIRINAPLASGDVLTIRRVTDVSEAAVEYRNGATTTAQMLNASFTQLLNSAQEYQDLSVRTVVKDELGRYDFTGGRIVNLGDPVDPQDGVTKQYVDDAFLNDSVAQAAAASAQDASDSADAAYASELKAADWAEKATAVEPGKYSAKYWAAQAQAVADAAAAAITVTPVGGIAATNVQTALEELDTEKAAAVHTHVIADTTGLQAALDAKLAIATATSTYVPKAGDVTITGYLYYRADPTYGWVTSQSGDATHTGLTSFYTPNDIRVGFIGYGTGGYLYLTGEAGWQWNIGPAAVINGGAPWTTVNFNPELYVTKAAPVMTGDATIYRSNAPTTGLLAMGNAGAYIFYDGANFVTSHAMKFGSFDYLHTGNSTPFSLSGATGATETVFPLGHMIMAKATAAVNANAVAASPRLDGSNQYVVSGSGTPLAGFWRARGCYSYDGGTNFLVLLQRMS